MSENRKSNLSEFLINSRFEVIPLKKLQESLSEFPKDITVAITCSSKKGIDETLNLAEQLNNLNLNLKLVPHIVARMIRSEEHLDEILKRLEGFNIKDIFLPGGDIKTPVGPFTSSLEVLKILAKKDHGLREIGITGYPEGHPLINHDILNEALEAKNEYANYIVTQMCFNHETILHWLRDIRKRGITIPAYIGVPGAVERKKLLEVSLKLGIGESLSFLKKNMGLVKSFFGPSDLSTITDELLKGLLPTCTQESLNIKGFHIYTFNQMENTFEWWQKKVSLESSKEESSL